MAENKTNNSNIADSGILIYQTEDGHTKIDVKFEDETVWLTQAQLCELYQTSKSNISEHIKYIFEEKRRWVKKLQCGIFGTAVTN